MRDYLGSYVNGNTVVFMYDDGTKERYVRDGETPAPEFPESIDLCITHQCDMGCPMCYVDAKHDGAHGDLSLPLLDTLQPYTELAIGGGNPLQHPDLIEFLFRMREKRVICNMTVNWEHFYWNHNLLKRLTEERLIYGLGISVPCELPDYDFMNEFKDFPNAVIHTIAGVTPYDTYRALMDRDLNLLILGYKLKGRGVEYYEDMDNRVVPCFEQLAENLMSFRHHFRGVAFDNLAVRQFDLKHRLLPDEVKNFYMGDDGEFTMYIDLVDKMYAKSSACHGLHVINDDNVAALFQNLKKWEDELWESSTDIN